MGTRAYSGSAKDWSSVVPMKKKSKSKPRTPNTKFGRQEPSPFRDVVERLLQTPPDRKK
jgi:hypothetical protein